MQKGRFCVMGPLEIIASIAGTSSANLSKWTHQTIGLFVNGSDGVTINQFIDQKIYNSIQIRIKVPYHMSMVENHGMVLYMLIEVLF